jgi:DNA-binding NarL/FixJ family response regulator
LIAEDQGVVVVGIRALLEPTCDIVGEAEDGRTLLVEALRLRPDIIITEVLLPFLNGVDAARHLLKLIPQTKIIFLTLQASSRHVADAFKAGASAYVLKRSRPVELTRAIEAAVKGQRYLSPLIANAVPANGANDSHHEATKGTLSSLTARQREVLQLIAEGRGTKEVATLLNISVKTVEFHKFRIMDHLDLHSTVALTKHALAEGLISL